MNQTEIIQELSDLFLAYFKEKVDTITAFPHTASGRRYFRMEGANYTVIGAYGKDKKENTAFIHYSEVFNELSLNVPEVFISKDNLFYLQEDLGDESLMDRNKKIKRKDNFPKKLKSLYQKSIDQLTTLQIKSARHIDYSLSYPRSAFDKQSMMWDLNYFKYYFLNVSDVSFDEQLLEDDFSILVNYLLSTDTNYFLFRDFQSRNIMLVEDEPFFIDYQGGRKGALQYDLASLLFQSKANIPSDVREELLEYYMESASRFISIDKKEFKEYYYGYVFIRLIQVLGAYGKRGLIEKMPYFIQSIPLALENIKWWIDTVELPIKIPYLISVLSQLTKSEQFKTFDMSKAKNHSLVVRISSFSYREGIPKDLSANGGGFVFDCRNILNPGRFEPYKTQTGRDKPVQDFLLEKTEMSEFLVNTYSLVDRAVENYLEREFEHLMVSYGCTGGQHRSVFSADSLAKHLEEKYGVKTTVQHVVQERKKWVNETY
ncbi:MAG: aminoglycoside/choline kinase family phosphotransferase [Maribacter sp.]